MRKIALLIIIAPPFVFGCGSGPGTPGASSPGVLEQVLEGRGQIIDLTHKLSPSIPTWPGEKPFHYEVLSTVEKGGAYLGFFSMPEHMGTHVDAPNHFVAGRASVDALDPRQLIAPAVVIDAREQVARDPDYRLTVQDIRRWERAERTRLPPGALVFMRSGWDARWHDVEAYRNEDEKRIMHFPGFSVEAARFLVNEREIRGIGIDTLSVDYGPSADFPVHRVTLGAGKYQVENAANLGELPANGAVVIVAPIDIEGGSGGPARVFALLPSSVVRRPLSVAPVRVRRPGRR